MRVDMSSKKWWLLTSWSSITLSVSPVAIYSITMPFESGTF